MMNNWKQSLIPASTTLRETIKTIDTSAIQIALVVDRDQRLLGAVTDGDVRRGILRGLDLDASVSLVMNQGPTTAHINETRENILLMMRQKHLHQIPVLDDHGRVTGIEILDDLLLPAPKKNQVAIMAGGMGSRLRPLTDDTPKPMLRIGSKPLLETILDNFIEYGFKRFHLAVNYRAEQVIEYFGDGSRWGVEISYLRESERLGTAGALGLIEERPAESLLVMNGDLLTKINFKHLLDFHHEHKAQATMCVAEYDFQVPYGVLKLDRGRILGIDEKPTQRFFINAGIYALEPSALELISRGQPLDMTSLFERLVELGRDVIAFPIREYWLDVGRVTDLQKAHEDFQRLFVPVPKA